MRYKKEILRLAFVLMSFFAIVACKESVDTSSRYVFKTNTVLSYLEKHEEYSEYVDLLNRVKVGAMSESTVAQLMSARGNYTVFAPTNDAIHNYMLYLVEEELIAEPSWEAFTDSVKLDSIRRVIVHNSIIDGGDDVIYETGGFPTADNAELAISNMNGRKLTVHYIENEPDSIYIDGDCPINDRNRDIFVLNGIIHQMEKVVAPTIVSLGGKLREVLEEQKGPYLVTARCIMACGYMDTLDAVRDEVYERLRQSGVLPERINATSAGLASVDGHYAYAPEHRKYGFTIFSETDEWWEEQLGKPAKDIMPEDVKQWVVDNKCYPDAQNNDNYKDEDNVLNQWISYHILPYRLSADRLVIHYNEQGYYEPNHPTSYTIPVTEHLVTLGKRRLVRLYESRESNGVYLNRFPKLNNGRKENGHEAYCLPSRVGCFVDKDSPLVSQYNMENGFIYSIDAPLSYNDSVRNNMARQRLRYEVMSFFPEAMNNDIRRLPLTAAKYQFVWIYDDSQYKYFDNMSINEGSVFVYFNAYGKGWGSNQGDEFKGVGRYEVVLKLPPVPRRGTYELRYRVLATTARGVAQLYFGENPNNLPVVGIPVDLVLCGDAARCGESGVRRCAWEPDTGDEDYDSEIDKRMRNNGFMKGEYGLWNGSTICRADGYKHIVRHLVTRQTLDPDKTYYIKFKSVLDSDRKELYLDTIELCPKEVYDNPETPEDIW